MSDPRNEERRAILLRLLLDNIGGFLALASVIASSGMIMERINNQAKVIDEARHEQKIMARDVNRIQENIAEIKGKLAVHDIEIRHIREQR